MFDFGGVVIESPFIAFAEFEKERGLPAGFLRSINATNPDTNAWAKLERSEISVEEFDVQFRNESSLLGHAIGGAEVLQLLSGAARPEMVYALDVLTGHGYRIVCLTNNVRSEESRPKDVANALSKFERVYESSELGVRKPETAFYEAVLDDLGVDPSAAVFLDDLGVNLKPARAMGITTVKVESAPQALDDLGRLLGLNLLEGTT